MTERVERQKADIRTSLLESCRAIFNRHELSPVLAALKTLRPSLREAFILTHVPDQAEDFYSILIDMRTIVRLVLPRLPVIDPKGLDIRVIDRHGFQKQRLSVAARRRLEAALELMAQKLEG